MPDYRVRSDDPLRLGDAFVAALEYARAGTEVFAVGPFNMEAIMSNGIHLTGDCQGCVDHIRETVDAVTVERMDT